MCEDLFIVAGSFQMNIIWLICSWLFLFSQDDIEENEEARGCLALTVDHCYYKLQTFAVTTTVTAKELSKKHSLCFLSLGSPFFIQFTSYSFIHPVTVNIPQCQSILRDDWCRTHKWLESYVIAQTWIQATVVQSLLTLILLDT